MNNKTETTISKIFKKIFKGQEKLEYLILLPRLKLFVEECDGSKNIMDAKDVFDNIGSEFKDCCVDEKRLATKKTHVCVYDLKKDATFMQMFSSLNTDLRKLCFTQHQIINFVIENRYHEELDFSHRTNYFLLESHGRFFIVWVWIGFVRVDIFDSMTIFW